MNRDLTEFFLLLSCDSILAEKTLLLTLSLVFWGLFWQIPRELFPFRRSLLACLNPSHLKNSPFDINDKGH